MGKLKFKCNQCKHEWFVRNPKVKNRQCPNSNCFSYDLVEVDKEVAVGEKAKQICSDGEIAAEAFKLFEKHSPVRVVIELQQPPEKIKTFYEEWLELKGLDPNHVKKYIEFLDAMQEVEQDVIELKEGFVIKWKDGSGIRNTVIAHRRDRNMDWVMGEGVFDDEEWCFDYSSEQYRIGNNNNFSHFAMKLLYCLHRYFNQLEKEQEL